MNFPQPRCDAPLVVFDFDHTLYDGDSGSHLFKWLIERAWWRRLLAILVAPVAGPMVAWLPTRRRGISVFVWIGTVGLHRLVDLDGLIDRYVATHVDEIRSSIIKDGPQTVPRRQLRFLPARTWLKWVVTGSLRRKTGCFSRHFDRKRDRQLDPLG